MPRTRHPVLTDRVLNRTLLQRQHLLERVDQAPLAVVEHLLGLQAQDVLPPYLSLAARLTDPDPHRLSGALVDRRAVRLLLMRGTLHLVTADDAVVLRPWVQPFLDGQARVELGRGHPPATAPATAAAIGADALALLADGPLSGSQLGERLAAARPGLTAARATAVAKTLVPLVQLPPRGTWGRSGGQVYLPLTTWLDRELAEPDPGAIVRRWLRAYGPGSPADVTTWSGVRGLREVFASLGDELVRYDDERGRAVFDLAGLPLADPDVPAPVRLLGVYDNLWLAHSDRTRVTTPERRREWAGPNGGVAAAVLVDGMLEGLWRRTPAGALDVRLFRPLTRGEQVGLDDEVARVDRLISRP